LLPTLGIHHHNRYNHYCLADDIMEPYRPFVDALVKEIVAQGKASEPLTPQIKKYLLTIGQTDVLFEDERSPLMVGIQRTTASLARCFEGTTRKLQYPRLP
jgi:CRISPR-associated protein Cas1